MALKGKNVVVNVSEDGVAWQLLEELNDASVTMDGDNIEVTVFGNSWINRIQGLKDGSWSLSGFYDSGTNPGQVLIRDRFLNDEDIYLQILYDGTNGFNQQALVSSLEISAAVDGAIELSIDMEGTGPMNVES